MLRHYPTFARSCLLNYALKKQGVIHLKQLCTS
ncbi:hypothetical protein CA85_18880 [Allorhodopirellula solitaria]|uniref:Uncharacterized protein n=1 Tax=Allorhodopirellula solitaria TaxID=2527987 RepID=A0A5C5YCG8_9BACT|nr:hypothetical protein CA85_18880 [Allorhodopirellula solitaria]